jgi:6-phosphofructo-2-kinase/fructose-2,6-biphosphatase
MEARHKALLAAMEDMIGYLGSEKGQVAIFDATNTTEERRQFLVGGCGAGVWPRR